MERKIGEVIEIGGVKAQVVEALGTRLCHQCVELDNCTKIGPVAAWKNSCMAHNRSDKTSVIFRKLESQ